jgi:transposase
MNTFLASESGAERSWPGGMAWAAMAEIRSWCETNPTTSMAPMSSGRVIGGSGLWRHFGELEETRPRLGECQFNPHIGPSHPLALLTSKWTMKRKNSGAKKQNHPVFDESLRLIEPEAAAIDIGSRSHWVAVNPQREAEPVREFGSFTTDLNALADWLSQCAVSSVVMEATGVYWVTVYELLESRGFKVAVVDAHTARHLPGRPKSDVKDCQWLRRLHCYGLLRGSFRPAAQIRRLRSYLRSRSKIVEAAAQQQLRMQKALTLMNIQLHHVISDLMGLTGLLIVRAIVAGERDPQRLALLRDPRVRASAETIRKSLTGNWQEELLFDLKVALQSYDHFQSQIAAYDQQIGQELKKLPSKVDVQTQPLPAARARACRKRPGTTREAQLALREELYRISGVDLTTIDGISLQTAQKVFFEIGTDVSAWPDEKRFCSWLGLSPNHHISGGKILKRKSRKVLNPLSTALRLAARTLRNSRSALGANFRRLTAKLGMPKAITAMARKLAVLIYRMLKFGTQYVDKGLVHYETKYQQTRLQYLRRQAASLGMKLVPAATGVH